MWNTKAIEFCSSRIKWNFDTKNRFYPGMAKRMLWDFFWSRLSKVGHIDRRINCRTIRLRSNFWDPSTTSVHRCISQLFYATPISKLSTAQDGNEAPLGRLLIVDKTVAAHVELDNDCRVQANDEKNGNQSLHQEHHYCSSFHKYLKKKHCKAFI